MRPMAVSARRRTLNQLLDEARGRVKRYEPGAALAAVDGGALMIDIRDHLDRQRDGIVPGSLHIPRTVLEWRLDPDSEWRNPYVGGVDQELILLCDHGCSSLLAAATLADLGFRRVSDVIGGFAAWRKATLPTAQASPDHPPPGELPGMRPPSP